jgi:plastocyanin
MPRIPAALLAGVFTVACGGQQPAQRTPPPDAKRVDQSKAGHISGRVTFEGQVPENPRADMAGHDVCASANKDGFALRTFLVENGGLNNVFVYVKDGLGNYYFDTPAQVVKVDQQGCRYVPHVFGAQVGQPIEISNGDPTMHNVGAVAKGNRAFNFSQPMQGLKNTVTFNAPEVMIRLKCDVHIWMSAYAGILDHPYYAVTADGGRFELKNVPAGTYTVEAWHEKLGIQTQNLTLGENDSKEVSFTFKAPA